MQSKFIKIIITVCMVLSLLILSVPSNAYASALTSPIPEVPSEIADKYSTIVIAKSASSDTVYMLASNAKDVMIRWGDSAIVMAENGSYVNGYRYILDNGKWVYERETFGIAGTNDGIYQVPIVYYTTKPIYKQDSSTSNPIPSSEMVFQSTSHINQALVGGVTVTPILQTILGLTKLLIPLLVGWVALRKALALLSRILHEA